MTKEGDVRRLRALDFRPSPLNTALMRPRFSLRWLLIFTAAVAVACYWWIARPTITANRFAAAVEQGEFAAAESMASDSETQTLFKTMFSTLEQLKKLAPTNAANSDATLAEKFAPMIQVKLAPRSWNDLLYSERRLVLTAHGDNDILSLVMGFRPPGPFAMPFIARRGAIDFSNNLSAPWITQLLDKK
jgi:hypothetical protein